MVALHPYEYTYYNPWPLPGGKGLCSRFEKEYWGISMKEAVATLEKNCHDGEKKITVYGNMLPYSTQYYLARNPQKFAWGNVEQDSDFSLINTNATDCSCESRAGWILQDAVARLGVVYVCIYRNARSTTRCAGA